MNCTETLLDHQPERNQGQVEGSLADFGANVWNTAGRLLAMRSQFPSIRHLESRSARPLSPAQERLWTLEQSEPGAAYYHVPLAWEIEGELDIPALERSLEWIQQRHEILRTSFPEKGNQPLQEVHHHWYKLEREEVRVGTGADRRLEAYRMANEFTRRPFNLATGPLFRTALYRWAPARHLFVVVVHQMIFDGASMRIFARELAECYRAFAAGVEPSLPELPITYGDFAVWQRKFLNAEAMRASAGFWGAQLQKCYEPLRLRTDRPRDNDGITPGAQMEICIPRSLANSLRVLANRHQVTRFAALLGSFQAYLGQYLSQTDVLALVSIAGRHLPVLKDLIGLVANVVPMRLDLSGEPSFGDILRRAGNMSASALANQMLPLSQILEMLPVSRGNMNTPALQVLMLYNNAPLPVMRLGGATFTPTSFVDNGTAKFDLTLDLADSPQGIIGQVKYRSDLFGSSTIATLLQDWQRFLEVVVEKPDVPLSQLRLPIQAPSTADSLKPGAESLSFPRETFNCRAHCESCDDLERTLVRIWEEIFNLRPIGIHDNFFGLGGHSLVAVKLIAAIEKETERKLRLCTIFNEPTIARLAGAMRTGKTDIYGSSIVEIQPKGNRPPLFMVHGVGGGMFWGYNNLAHHLGEDQPLYGFRSRGMDGLEEFTRIEDIAAQYVADLRKFQPSGPYYLGGYCFGGNVAFEMACQLREQGQRVGLLLLINCWPNNSSYTRLSWSPLFLAKAFWNFCVRLQHQIRWGATRPRDYFKWRTAWVRKRLKAMLSGRVEDRVAVDDFVDLSPRPEHEQRLWRTHVQAWLQYQPRVYSGRVVLFRTRGHPLICSFDGEMGWGSFAAQGVMVRTCPGDHESILDQENVAHTARELKAVLESVQTTSHRGPQPPGASEKDFFPVESAPTVAEPVTMAAANA